MVVDLTMEILTKSRAVILHYIGGGENFSTLCVIERRVSTWFLWYNSETLPLK